MKSETIRQKILRACYPLIRTVGKKALGTVRYNKQNTPPKTSLYGLQVPLNDGTFLDFSEYKNKKFLLVNTASDCGYTGQYAELQALHEKAGEQLLIVAFPANDFAQQEKGSNKEIAQFCLRNYGVSFPIARKGVVIRSQDQQAVFHWLTHSSANGWNDHAPEWNFSKYLVDEAGILTHYFGSSISPLAPEMLAALGL